MFPDSARKITSEPHKFTPSPEEEKQYLRGCEITQDVHARLEHENLKISRGELFRNVVQRLLGKYQVHCQEFHRVERALQNPLAPQADFFIYSPDCHHVVYKKDDQWYIAEMTGSTAAPKTYINSVEDIPTFFDNLHEEFPNLSLWSKKPCKNTREYFDVACSDCHTIYHAKAKGTLRQTCHKCKMIRDRDYVIWLDKTRKKAVYSSHNSYYSTLKWQSQIAWADRQVGTPHKKDHTMPARKHIYGDNIWEEICMQDNAIYDILTHVDDPEYRDIIVASFIGSCIPGAYTSDWTLPLFPLLPEKHRGLSQNAQMHVFMNVYDFLQPNLEYLPNAQQLILDIKEATQSYEHYRRTDTLDVIPEFNFKSRMLNDDLDYNEFGSGYKIYIRDTDVQPGDKIHGEIRKR